jgi:hypothetical protein
VLAALISSPHFASWNQLSLMLGTASAALIGLLFVATSLHLAEIANEEIYRLRAQYTTLFLLSTLVQGTVILMPQPMKILGFELLAINLWGLSFPVTLLSKAVKIPGARGRGGFLVSCVGLHCRICNWHCRSWSRRYRPRVGNVWSDRVLHGVALYFDLERLDDYAGHRARRKISKMK